nr:MAG TPA: replisome organizer [Caudoviricetes sp.]
MAERRMFAKTIIDSDAFIDMPLSAQALYLHLSMRADDDGFVNNPKRIQRMIGAADDDMKLLVAKSFLIPFENGIVVIKHWKVHNYIRSDRYTPTVYQEEKNLLTVEKSRVYTVGIPSGIPNGYQMDTQYRLGKDRLGKDRLVESIAADDTPPAPAKTKHKYGEYNNVRLTDDEINKLNEELGAHMTTACITFLDEYIEMKGYKAKSHYLAIKKWVVSAVKERQPKEQDRLAWLDEIDWSGADDN